MRNPWDNCVNQTSGVSVISDINNYISNFNANRSPIDSFYSEVRDMIRTATPSFLASHNWAGSLILVGIISATENYFRDIFSKVMGFCPIAKSCSTSQKINLGSVVWHNGINFERGAFEHIALSGADNIIKTSKDFLKFDIVKGSSLHSILEEFDKVCELRHGIVHSNAIFAGKNALRLGILPNGNMLKINISYDQLQECASICNALVGTYNTELFNEMVNRWANKWRKINPSYTSKENTYFKLIWEVFYSKVDEAVGLITNRLTMIKCRNVIKRTYGI